MPASCTTSAAARWASATPTTNRRAPTLAELFSQIGMRPGTRDGEFAMTMPVSPQVVNTSGALQGGLIATLVDVAGGQFGLDYLQPGTTMTTADLFIRYLRPIRQGSAFAVPRMLRSRPARDGHADRHLRRR